MYQAECNGVKVDLEAKTIKEAKRESDNWSSYTQKDLYLLKGGKQIAVRTWYSCQDGIDGQKDPIDFGFGFYADWQSIS